MSEHAEEPQQPQTDTPHDDDLDVEAPNESAPGHNPPEEADAETDAER
jgi:hypothetical protein